MVIYANTHHNSAEEAQLTPTWGNCTSQGFYGTEITLLHHRGCGLPYKLAVEKLRVATGPQTTCITGCPLNAASSGSILALWNQKPSEWGLRICISINMFLFPPDRFYDRELDHLSEPGLPWLVPSTSRLCTQWPTLLLCHWAVSLHLFQSWVPHL